MLFLRRKTKLVNGEVNGNDYKTRQKGNLTKLDLDYEGTKDGEDQVKNYLEIVQQKLGFIPNVLAAFAKFPKQFEGFTKLYNALMLGESV